MWRGKGRVTEDMLNRPIYDELKRVAREQRTTTYSEIAHLAGLEMENQDDRNRMGEILGKISTYEHQDGRPMLTAVVVHKHDNMPGDGFFELAQRLGLMPRGEDRLAFFARELTRVLRLWRPARPAPRDRTR